MLLYHPFKPFFDENSRILMLGSFPSLKSRELGFYYQNKNNRFYQILELLFNLAPKSLTKQESQKAFLKAYKIALWDIFKSCDITKSKDESINLKDINTKANDLSFVLEKAPIKAVFTTGKKAHHAFCHFYVNFKQNYPSVFYHTLPSSSSANARFSLEKLVDEYKLIKAYL
ncbi:DNA-deoxyinosine glycosylase [Campylobacter sp. MIT 12-5580]|uniref:DNA-deoxyinosine glycosylase n=1 Tax=Campylobacter sp. MIT 12-5580 TaxID=2040651 RepID=UPI0010F664B0|nr:DNA-deoxyinosine glycosylase [Campylobacter sp. MIT 12-5580]TKX28367.1 DNA-deoxyinosine glycosylase [Campylobacter sp. MIT 12-5580]